jgi:hypothetical protein
MIAELTRKGRDSPVWARLGEYNYCNILILDSLDCNILILDSLDCNILILDSLDCNILILHSR